MPVVQSYLAFGIFASAEKCRGNKVIDTPQWHKTSELLLLSGDLPSLQVHYSSHLSPSQTILIETVSGTHNEQPLNGLVTAMHSHDWKSTFKVTTQVMHFHFIKKIVPE